MSIFEKLMSKTVDDAGCAVWHLSCCSGHPAVRINKKTVLVRRVIWEEFHGKIDPGKIVRMTCGAQKCIDPNHMELTTYLRLAKKLGAIGIMSGHLRSAKIAATKRAKYAKLNAQAVQEIRSSQESGRAMAEKFNVSEKHISRIRLNQSWKDFTSPFLGLPF